MQQQFYSTKTPGNFVGLKEAVLRSLPPDNGLYMPETLRPLPQEFWENWQDWSFSEMGYHVVQHLLMDSIPEGVLKQIVEEAINFPAPLVGIDEHNSILELFHGPSLAFKDFGARFMARLMGWLTREDEGVLTVLVATSGDTGGAVASAFHGVEGTQVIILYPSGKVSALQEKQLTTLGKNIRAVEIDGTFDDCQRLVKSAFLEQKLSRELNLTSANSINISRLIPQSLYYFEAHRQLAGEQELVFVVPSGNFGNLTAGILASKMGLSVKHFVAATNINDVVPQYLASGNYEPRPSIATISNAMDVGAPSNFVRMEEIFGYQWENMRQHISSFSFDDKETRAAIRKIDQLCGYKMDPHGAVGWLAAQKWLEKEQGDHCIILETAHPSKFLDVMEEELGVEKITIPERLACLAELEKEATFLPPDKETFISWLQDNV